MIIILKNYYTFSVIWIIGYIFIFILSKLFNFIIIIDFHFYSSFFLYSL